MIHTLLVPVDVSDDSYRAVDLACALAPVVGASVRVVEVVAHSTLVEVIAQGVARRCDERSTVQHARSNGVDVRVDVLVGETPATALIDALGDTGCRAVMASHGRGRTAALVGSVTAAVAAEAPTPVLCVGPEAGMELDTSGWSGPVVATVDGSDLSARALPAAAGWAEVLEVPLRIVAVRRPGDEPEQGIAVDHETLSGDDVVRTVTAFATEHEAVLIVAATQGRSGLDRLVLGSTAAGFVRHAPCPVLLVNRSAGG